MARPLPKALLLCAALAALSLSSCGGGEQTTASGGTDAATTGTSPDSAGDRAARLAAETQLRNAQTAQETYFAEHQEYAATSDQLKSVAPHLSAKVVVARGGINGYEMSVQANDAAQTVLIIRKTGSRVERTDSGGNAW